MAAFVGWLVATGNQVAIANGHDGIHFPGYCSQWQTGTTFADIAAAGGPMEQWEAVPEVGKLQIIGAIFIIEHQSEWKIKPHYMAGGTPGSLKGLKNFWDPIGITRGLDAKKLERQRLSELKNGRAAMLGIIGCLIAGKIPGAIPVAPTGFFDGAAFVEPFGTFASYHSTFRGGGSVHCGMCVASIRARSLVSLHAAVRSQCACGGTPIEGSVKAVEAACCHW